MGRVPRGTMHDDAHEQLIHAIYDAADDAAGLAPILNRIGHVLRAHAGQGFVIPITCPSAAESHHYGGPSSGFETYERDWRDKDPRYELAMKRPNEVLADTMVLDMAAFERSDVHHEVLAKWDNHYSLFGNHLAAPDLMFAAAWLRAKREGPFGDTEVRHMEALAPHMKRAVRLRHLVGSLRDEIADLQRALDAVPLATLILDEKSAVVCANRSAEDILRARDGLVTERGRLSASRIAERAALEKAIAKALLNAAPRSTRREALHLVPTVKVSRSNGPTLSIAMLPLRPQNAIRTRAARHARILALVHDPSRTVRIDRALVADLHGLTATEAELAAQLAEGKTLAEFAKERGTSEQTARTHLKRILEKTETRRQAELVRVLLTGAAIHGLR